MIFLIRDIDGPAMTGVCRWDPVHSRPEGLPGLALGPYWSRTSAYTARAAASIGGYISVQVLSQLSGYGCVPSSVVRARPYADGRIRPYAPHAGAYLVFL